MIVGLVILQLASCVAPLYTAALVHVLVTVLSVTAVPLAFVCLLAPFK